MVKKNFGKMSYNGKFGNNQGFDMNFVGKELIHTNKEVTVEIILCKYNIRLNHLLSFKDSIPNS